MRKVIYSMMVTLDGYIEGPNRDLNWGIVDEELHRYINEQDRKMGAHLYGRRTYEVMQAFWPTADADSANPTYIIEYAHIWKNMPKIVFSRTLEQVEANARLVRENIAEVVRELKAQPGGDLIVGGADIASTFMQLGLIDEYQLYIHPVILGGGTPMFFSLGSKMNLRLVDAHKFDSGVILLRYQPAEES